MTGLQLFTDTTYMHLRIYCIHINAYLYAIYMYIHNIQCKKLKCYKYKILNKKLTSCS